MKHGDLYIGTGENVMMYIDNSLPCNNVINLGVYEEMAKEQQAGVTLLSGPLADKTSSIIKLNHKSEWVIKELGINIIDVLKEAGIHEDR